MTDFYNNWTPDEAELKELVYVNPTATAIMVNTRNQFIGDLHHIIFNLILTNDLLLAQASYMFDYAGGIYDDEACCNYPDTNCGTNINHAVAVVGYGTEAGQVESEVLNTA